jgi:hypothetical protein
VDVYVVPLTRFEAQLIARAVTRLIEAEGESIAARSVLDMLAQPIERTYGPQLSGLISRAAGEA